MKLIDQITGGARNLLSRLRGLVTGALLLGTVISASAAAQPPFIGAFYHYSNSGGTHTSTVTGLSYNCHAWEIQLGSPSIQCDSIFFQVTRGQTLHESTTSGLSSPAAWILSDSGTGGSTRYIKVKAFYDGSSPYYNSYYLTYQDSYYSRCYEENGYVGIYNP